MQTELHRHLDVSIRPKTLLALLQERGLESQKTSLSAFQDKLILRQPMKDLDTVLATFSLVQKIFDHPNVLEQVASEVVEDCWNEGTRKLELRYAPGFVSEFSKLSWEESLVCFEQGIAKALERYPEMQVGLICIAERHQGVEKVDEAIEFFLKHFHRFVGLDLAGNELDFPGRLFEASFKKAIQRGANITVHAGEAGGPDNIWDAIELLGAKRIGHGVASLKDPMLMKYLEKHQICLEMCPTSNWLTRAVKSLQEHPLPKILRSGVPVSINTDDPAIFGVTMKDEMKICQTQLGLSSKELEQCENYAAQASFIQSSRG
jgi:adenosine deaminase